MIQWLAAAVAPQSSICMPCFIKSVDELTVRIPGLNWMTGLNATIGIVRSIVQHEIGSVSVKYGNNFTFDVPAAEVSGE